MEEIEILDLEDSKKDNPKENLINNNQISILNNYGEDLTAKTYITNPAISRESEIKKLMMVLLTPEKSALLIGKPGIGKTAIVEGLAYLIINNQVPDSLKNYRIIKFNSSSLVGKIMVNGKEEMIITLLVNELKSLSKVIIFIDEIHTLMGGNSKNPMDLANILKPGLDRGDIKAIGATTTEEYQTYVIKDRAFLRRFDRIDVLEPTEDDTVQILMGTLPKIEKQTGIKFKYNSYITQLLMESIVSATSEFKRVYGLSAMYPDVAFSVLQQSFSQALYNNRSEVNVLDVYNAIKTSKRIYPDSIVKELQIFRDKFVDVCNAENIVLPLVSLEEIQDQSEDFM